MEGDLRPSACPCLTPVERDLRLVNVEYPTLHLLVKYWLPIASNAGKSKFDQEYLEIIEPRKKICDTVDTIYLHK